MLTSHFHYRKDGSAIGDRSGGWGGTNIQNMVVTGGEGGI